MESYVIIKYTIPNWEKYNQEIGDTPLQWFKLSTATYLDEKIMELSVKQFRLWFCLINHYGCGTSTERGINEKFLVSVSQIGRNFCRTDVERLHNENLITIINIEEYREFSHNSIKGEKRREEKRRVCGKSKKDIATPPSKKIKPPPPVSGELQEVGNRWADHTNKKWPHLKADGLKYAQALEKAKKATGLNDSQMAEIFDFVSTDDFWKDACQSPGSLLKKAKDSDMRKIDNIITKLKKTRYPHEDVIKWAEENADEIENGGDHDIFS